MKQSFDKSISRNVLGLDDIMLKKLLLAYNTGNYSEKASIIIELSGEEVEKINNDTTLKGPFEMKKRKYYSTI